MEIVQKDEIELGEFEGEGRDWMERLLEISKRRMRLNGEQIG